MPEVQSTFEYICPHKLVTGSIIPYASSMLSIILTDMTDKFALSCTIRTKV